MIVIGVCAVLSILVFLAVMELYAELNEEERRHIREKCLEMERRRGMR